MNSKTKAIKKKTAERFAKNPFAHKYGEKNERREETREHEKKMGGIPSYLKRK